jgi:Ammonia permease
MRKTSVHRTRVAVIGLIAGCLLALPAVAWAQETPSEEKVLLDTVWVLVTAFLVFLMQGGFAMLEAGFTRQKNVANIVMKNMMDFSMSSLAYWVVGFALMFGAGNAFIGTSGWFSGPAEAFEGSLGWATPPLMAKWIFQVVFAGTAATIVSGAMAERTRFSTYLVFSLFISGLIYPVVGHWIWGGGWLAQREFLDFAGSTVVHSVGGWSALVGAIMLGPRIGKYSSDGRPRAIPGHSMSLAFLGVFLLWFGWFGFNPGSTLGASPSIAEIAVTTNLAAAIGAVTAMFASWVVGRKPDVGMAANGAIAGLVGITAGCAFVENWAALLIGGGCRGARGGVGDPAGPPEGGRPRGGHLGPCDLRRVGNACRRPVRLAPPR